jgi:Rad3-related DNA helicase/5-methylcytosine-specific restriction endonuclease McrA
VKGPYRSPQQAQYAKLIERAVSKPGAPLLAGAAPGLGKTHGYAIPLLCSGKKVAIAMSTRQLIDQFIASDALAAAQAALEAEGRPAATVVALQPRRQFETAVAYSAHKTAALDADVLVLTHMGVLIDTHIPAYAQLRQRAVLLFDEADLLADAADLRSTYRIEAEALARAGVENATPTKAVETIIKKSDDPEEKAVATAIQRALAEPAWYKVIGKEDNGDLVLTHRMPGRMLRTLINDMPRCIFTSGTLTVSGRFDHFVKAIGLTAVAPESQHIDPVQHGQLRVEVASEALTPEAQAERIMHAATPVLVLTTSHATTAALGSLCPGAICRAPGEALMDAVARCPDDGILIAAGAWSGLDAPRLRWQTVVIPKTPYGKPLILDAQQISAYVDSKVVAIRRTNQGLHRGLRTTDATCTLLLLDPDSRRADLRQAIPRRFLVDWDSVAEGSLVLRTHFARERKKGLREKTLSRRGQHCEHPGCTATQEHLLEVHHLNPIANGPRDTVTDDLRVLCKNHHADAHQAMRKADFLKVKTTEKRAEADT